MFKFTNKNILLILVFLSFLSGNFTLGRISEGINLEIKFLLVIFFVFYVVLSKTPIEINVKGINQKVLVHVLVFIFIYYAVLFLSILYSEDKAASLTNYLGESFVLILICLLVYTISWYDRQEFFKLISMVMVVFGLIFTIPVFADVLAGGSRGYFSLGGPNVTTRFIFFALCCSLYRFSITKKNIYILLALFFAAGIVFVGSRGGLVGFGVTLLTLWIVKKVLTRWKIKKEIRFSPKKLLILVLSLGAFSLIYKDVSRVFMKRFINTTFTGDGVYTAGRDVLYNESISMISEKPLLGHGIFSFSIRTGEKYPHNMVLEMMNNIGILGLLFFLGFLGISIYLIFKYRKSDYFIFSGLPFYTIVVQMFSGGLYDFRFYFFWAIPLLILKEKRKEIM